LETGRQNRPSGDRQNYSRRVVSQTQFERCRRAVGGMFGGSRNY
jgi:hypothetical protein